MPTVLNSKSDTKVTGETQHKEHKKHTLHKTKQSEMSQFSGVDCTDSNGIPDKILKLKIIFERHKNIRLQLLLS